MQFWSEILLVIASQTSTAHLFDFEIMHMISAQIALHSVQLPLEILRFVDQSECEILLDMRL